MHRGRITALVLLATAFLVPRSPRGWVREMLRRGDDKVLLIVSHEGSFFSHLFRLDYKVMRVNINWTLLISTYKQGNTARQNCSVYTVCKIVYSF